MHFERNKVQLECYDELVTCVLKMWPDFALICHMMAWNFVVFCLSCSVTNVLNLVSKFKIKRVWKRQWDTLSFK